MHLYRLAGEKKVKWILLLGIEVQLVYISKTILFRGNKLRFFVLRLKAEPRWQGW